MPAEEILTVDEVAKELRINARTVRQYIASGELAAMMVGRGFKITREDLEDFKRRKRIRRPSDKNSETPQDGTSSSK